jgi:muskelin
VRKQRFVELCANEPSLSALLYLQTSLSSITDHSDESEATAFRSCMSYLLAVPPRQQYTVADRGERMDEDDPADESNADAGVERDEASAERGKDGMVSVQDLTPRWPVKEAGGAVDQRTYEQRTQVFESLLRFFAPADQQPGEDLVDIVRWEGELP